MTQLGFCSISAMDRPIGAVADLAASLDLDGVEVTARAPHLDPQASLGAAREIGRDVRRAGVDVIAYGSYLGRFGERSLAQAEREAAIAAALGTRLIRVWAEPAPERGEQDFADVLALLRRVCDAAAPDGTTVVVERHVGSFADTPDRIERLLSAVGRLNFALNYQVLDLLPDAAADAQPGDAERLVRHARYFHLKNYQANPQAGGPMLPGGTLEGGRLDYRAILERALRAGYDGPMTFEFLSFEPRPVEEKLAADVAFVRGVLRDLSR